MSTVFIVGAGASFAAGLPIASKFTQALLDCRRLPPDGPSATLVRFLRTFVDDVFGRGADVPVDDWPLLEDLFTTVDLAANSGHHLGPSYSAADLRSVRRALILRMMRMLRSAYDRNERKPDDSFRYLQEFYRRCPLESSCFLSMNWDTVIEDSLLSQQRLNKIDYGCGALAARFDGSGAVRRWIIRNDRDPALVLKPHGSLNWMYCDACRRLYWFSTKSVSIIAGRLFKESDRAVVARMTGTDVPPVSRATNCPGCKATAMGTRFATFSYRKALDFPMYAATWRKAEDRLRTADNWVFFGYSMPGADYEFKHMLKQTQLARRLPPRIFIITGGADASATIDNYRRFFGRKVIDETDVFRLGINPAAIRSLVSADVLTA